MAIVQHSVRRGILLIILTAFGISAQDVIFKLFTDTLPFGQIFAVRGFIVLALLAVLARLQKLSRKELLAGLTVWPLLRSVLITLFLLTFYSAIPFVNLSTLGAATYTAPIFVALLSALLVKEPVSARGWIAVIVGFVGVIVLLQPGADAFSFWAALPLAGAVCYALAHITTRHKCQGIKLIPMVLSLTLVMTGAGLLISAAVWLWSPGSELVSAYPYLIGGWRPIGMSEWLVLAVLASMAIAVSAGLAGAYQAAPPPIIATFEYSYLVFVALWDMTVFDAPPSLATIIGMVIIFGAGLLLLRPGAGSARS